MSERARYWARMVAAWQTSGLSQAEFCRRRGVSAASFAWWKRRLRGPSRLRQSGRAGRRSACRVAPGTHRGPFVEVVLPDPIRQAGGTRLANNPGAAGSAVGGGYAVTVHHGRVIHLPPDFDPQTVARLIQTVEGCLPAPGRGRGGLPGEGRSSC